MQNSMYGTTVTMNNWPWIILSHFLAQLAIFFAHQTFGPVLYVRPSAAAWAWGVEGRCLVKDKMIRIWLSKCYWPTTYDLLDHRCVSVLWWLMMSCAQQLFSWLCLHKRRSRRLRKRLWRHEPLFYTLFNFSPFSSHSTLSAGFMLFTPPVLSITRQIKTSILI